MGSGPGDLEGGSAARVGLVRWCWRGRGTRTGVEIERDGEESEAKARRIGRGRGRSSVAPWEVTRVPLTRCMRN